MDRRNSKESMLDKIQALENKLEEVYQAGYDGIGHVGRANYHEREMDAIRKLNIAMYGCDE